MNNICDITDLVREFSYEENRGFNLVIKLATPLTCMTQTHAITLYIDIDI